MSAQPLVGVRVAVTRARTQAEELAEPLRLLGAEVLVSPLIRISPTTDSEVVRTAVRDLATYDWLVFSSANGVDLLVDAMRVEGIATDVLRSLRVACVGPATAAAAFRHGIQTAAMPDEFIGDAIADVLARQSDLRGARVLLARAAGSREVLPRLLAERGAEVSDVHLYKSELDKPGAALLRDRLAADQLDVVTFTSGSTVRYFAQAIGEPGRAAVAVIGPATAEVAKDCGLPVTIAAEPHTSEGLISAIVRHYSGDRPTGG